MASFAHLLKESGRGVIFIADNFVYGMIGNNASNDFVTEFEAACKEMSPKKMNKKNKVKFDFKKKGQKPIETKDIVQFDITGGTFKEEVLTEIFNKHKVLELE